MIYKCSTRNVRSDVVYSTSVFNSSSVAQPRRVPPKLPKTSHKNGDGPKSRSEERLRRRPSSHQRGPRRHQGATNRKTRRRSETPAPRDPKTAYRTPCVWTVAEPRRCSVREPPRKQSAYSIFRHIGISMCKLAPPVSRGAAPKRNPTRRRTRSPAPFRSPSAHSG